MREICAGSDNSPSPRIEYGAGSSLSRQERGNNLSKLHGVNQRFPECKKYQTRGGAATRILGLDIGDKRIGVAVSDEGGSIAGPLTIIGRTDDSKVIGEIIDIIRQNEIGIIIAGLPVTMRGEIGHQAEKIIAFIDELKSRTEIPVEYRDESLTTLEARRLMQRTRKKKRREREPDDAIAAAYLLQGYLDEKHKNSGTFDIRYDSYDED